MQVNVTLPAGSSLEASNEVCRRDRRQADARCRRPTTNPNGAILHFVRRTGRAELDEHAEPVNRSEYILTMNPDCGLQPRGGPRSSCSRT